MKFYGKSFFKTAFSLGALITLSGCATVGAPFTFQGTDSIVVGKTTQSDITERYGRPFRVGFENGKTKWTYGYYQYRLFSESETKDLTITFSPRGVVSDYTYSSSNPEEVDKALVR